MTPTQPTPPAPPPGPPPTPPPGPPPSPGAAPAKKSGGANIWLILFIVVGVLFVGALVFAIISFTGKNAEADDKEKAEQELASTKRELEQTQEELGTQTGAGEILGELVQTGETSADNLKSCVDSGFNLRNQIVQLLNDRQGGMDVNPRIDGLNAAIGQNDSECNNASQAYQDFKDAVAQLRNG
jgi:flagellar basal body-associated protein FliL